MKVKHLRKGKLEVSADTVKELLEKVGESEETVVVRKNKEIVLPDSKILEDDKIKLIPIVSGG